VSAPPRQDVTAIVLAGGRSSRFGAPKLAAELDGATLLDRAVRAVEAVAGFVIVGGPEPAAHSGWSIPHGRPSTAGDAPASSVRFVDDDQPFAGPLAALAGALRETSTELAIIVGGDMPSLVPTVLAAMLGELASDLDIDAVHLAGPTESPNRQVLPLGLRVAPAAKAASESLGNGDRSLVRLLDRLRTVEIPAAKWLALDPAGQTLLDVDEPADLERWHGGEIR
jgi:molybdopterin-guanine dinucleotide biosynthesis protein A